MTLPMSRGRNGRSRRMRRSASRRMSRRLSVRCVAFVDAGEELDLLADFGVGGEVCGFDTLPAKAFGGLAFGGEVLGFDSLVHQASGFERDRLAEFDITHPFRAPFIKPMLVGAGLWII